MQPQKDDGAMQSIGAYDMSLGRYSALNSSKAGEQSYDFEYFTKQDKLYTSNYRTTKQQAFSKTGFQSSLQVPNNKDLVGCGNSFKNLT